MFPKRRRISHTPILFFCVIDSRNRLVKIDSVKLRLYFWYIEVNHYWSGGKVENTAYHLYFLRGPMLHGILLLQVMPKQAFAPPIKYILCECVLAIFRLLLCTKKHYKTLPLWCTSTYIAFHYKNVSIKWVSVFTFLFLPVFLYSVDGYIM